MHDMHRLREGRALPILFTTGIREVEVERPCAYLRGKQRVAPRVHERHAGRAVQTLVRGARACGDVPLIELECFRSEAAAPVDQQLCAVRAAERAESLQV